jgi:hypothetical protein
MAQSFIKLGEHYLVWSSIVDAPVTFGLTLEELRDYIEREDGRSGLENLARRLGGLNRYGISHPGYQDDSGLDDYIDGNRAGPDEDELTRDEIYRAYVLREPIRDGWLVPAYEDEKDSDDGL